MRLGDQCSSFYMPREYDGLLFFFSIVNSKLLASSIMCHFIWILVLNLLGLKTKSLIFFILLIQIYLY